MEYSILIACEDLRVGGVQTFVLRLAQALSGRHQVFLYNHYHDYIATGMVKRLAPSVEVIACQIPDPLDWTIRKADRLLYKLRVNFSIRERLIASHLLQTVKKHKIDVVHSNMFKSDLVVVKALQASGVPVVVTMHGDYESFLATDLGEKAGEFIHQYRRKVLRITAQARAIVYLTAKNLRVFDVYKEAEEYRKNGLNVRKIYNGFATTPSLEHTHICRESLGISTQALVFGMVARGIEEKGWHEAIQAFLLLIKDTSVAGHLILVGESDYLTELKNKYRTKTNIHFVGFSDNATDWITVFDIGLLPTYYSAESLPNSVIEYLYCGKPVISTNVGEIPHMISYGNKKAGSIINLDTQNKANTEELAYAMKAYIDSPALLKEHQSLARLAFQQFNMDGCVAQYTQLFEEVTKCNKRTG